MTGDLAVSREREVAKAEPGPKRQNVQPFVLELTPEGSFALGHVNALDDLTRSGAEPAAEFHP